MPPHRPLHCPSCGTVVGTGGGRCPTCGYLLPEDMPARPAAPVSRPVPQRRKAARGPVWLLVGAVALGVAALGFVVRARFAAQRARAPATVLSVLAPTASQPARAAPIDVSSFAARAASRATRWNADALLVSIEAFPVQAGKVDTTGDGFVEVIYGKPLKSRLGPGAPLTASRLVMRVDRDGSHELQRAEARAQKGIAESNCPVDEVSRVVAASGVDATSTIRLRYAASVRHGKPVWRAVAGDSKEARLIDGQSCAVLPK